MSEPTASGRRAETFQGHSTTAKQGKLRMMRQNWNWLLQPFYLDADGRYGQRLSHGNREPVAPGAACDDDRW